MKQGKQDRNIAKTIKFAEKNFARLQIIKRLHCCGIHESKKDRGFDMKHIQISQELFVVLIRYFLLKQEELLPEIKTGLEQKLDALIMRELYTKYKTASTKEDQEKARREYLDRRGIFNDFRW